jgi:predicted NBD/HSP70 family sugar kinase
MYLAIDVGATKTNIATFSPEGEIIEQKKLPTPATYKELIDTLGQTVVSFEDLEAFTVAIPGSFQIDGTITKLGNRKDWENNNLLADLKQLLAIPGCMLNDANAAALAEARLGAGKSYDTTVYITISTGVGTGITEHGQLIFPGSEGGHMYINNKLWEDIVSGPAIIERFGKPGPEISDPSVWKTIGEDIADGIHNISMLLCPDIIILGGGVSTHFDQFKVAMFERLQQRNPGFYPTPRVCRAEFTETAPLYGCYLTAKDLVK